MMHHIRQWLLSGAAILLIITGIALGLVLLATSPFADRFVRPALPAVGAVLMILFTLWLLEQSATSSTKGGTPSQTQRKAHHGGRQVHLARLQVKLDDPHAPRSFEQFLAQPLLLVSDPQSGGIYQTPLQVMERELLGYVRQLEHTHHGRMTVDIRLKRNSLTIALTFLAAYEFLAQYHDFAESIRLIRRQIQGMTQNATRWYEQATGRKLTVQSNLIMDAHSPNKRSARRARAATYASRFEKAAPTAAHSEVRVNIYGFSFPALLLTCLVALFVFLLGAGLVAALGCSAFADQNACARLVQEIVSWLARLLDPN
jgi:hypothetical protein